VSRCGLIVIDERNASSVIELQSTSQINSARERDEARPRISSDHLHEFIARLSSDWCQSWVDHFPASMVACRAENSN
jgi:hypothetical protein